MDLSATKTNILFSGFTSLRLCARMQIPGNPTNTKTLARYKLKIALINVCVLTGSIRYYFVIAALVFGLKRYFTAQTVEKYVFYYLSA